MIRISTNKPNSGFYVVRVGNNENSKKENKVCFYNFLNRNYNTFYCHMNGKVIWIHRSNGYVAVIYEIRVLTNMDQNPETDITSEATVSVSSFKDGYPFTHLYDGDLSTKCQAKSSPSWLKLKFSDLYTISHVQVKTALYSGTFFVLRVGMDELPPFAVPACSIILKGTSNFLKYWCYKKGNAVLITRNANFVVYEINVFKT